MSENTLLYYSRIYKRRGTRFRVYTYTCVYSRVCTREGTSASSSSSSSPSGRGVSVSSVCTRSRRAHARSGEREVHWMKSPTTISARDVAATNAHTYPGIGVSDKRRVRRVASRARLHDAAQNASLRDWKFTDRVDRKDGFFSHLIRHRQALTDFFCLN